MFKLSFFAITEDDVRVILPKPNRKSPFRSEGMPIAHFTYRSYILDDFNHKALFCDATDDYNFHKF